MTKLPFQDADPAHTDFQYLEDLATAYWYSEVLFAALDLKLFDHIGNDGSKLETLATAAACNPSDLRRLLTALEKLELVGKADGHWFNSQAAGRYLISGSASYLSDFLLYRRYMKVGWEALPRRVSVQEIRTSGGMTAEDDYELRNYQYVRAMDALAREKARDIQDLIAEGSWHPPILDVGGGAGALCRAMVRSKSDGDAYLFELPEVIRAARKIYPDERAWQRIHTISGDFRSHRFETGKRYGLILMGNFLHAYGADEARKLLRKAVSLLAPDGLLVVHDYFPDRNERSPHKGTLYDLSMMLNTYDGACHTAGTALDWLKDAGLDKVWTLDLSTDSSMILAAGPEGNLPEQPSQAWPYVAKTMGFRTAVEIPARDVILAPWVPVKCRFGCSRYGKNLKCPPHGIEIDQTEKILSSYERAVLVEGAPPGRQFHEKLLALERKAFLAGHHKALVFGAGPCPVCDACPDDGPCRNPGKARPSMEGAGMDVYETARKAGFSIDPVSRKGSYVKYIGLLLLE